MSVRPLAKSLWVVALSAMGCMAGGAAVGAEALQFQTLPTGGYVSSAPVQTMRAPIPPGRSPAMAGCRRPYPGPAPAPRPRCAMPQPGPRIPVQIPPQPGVMNVPTPQLTDPGGLRPGEERDCCANCCKPVNRAEVHWELKYVELPFNYADIETNSKPYCHAQCDDRSPQGGQPGVCHEVVGVQTTRKVVTRMNTVKVAYWHPVIKYVPGTLCVQCGVKMQGCDNNANNGGPPRAAEVRYPPNAGLEQIAPGLPMLRLEQLQSPLSLSVPAQ